MKTTKTIPFDKKHIVVEKDTFDSMQNVIKETKKAVEFQNNSSSLIVPLEISTTSFISKSLLS